MKKVCLALMLLLALSVRCFASEGVQSDDLADLESPLAGLMAVSIDSGTPYPSGGEVSNEYAVGYLFFMANIFYAADAEARAYAPDAFDEYVPMDEHEVALLLRWAFGAAFTCEDLESDGRLLVIDDGMYWLGLAEGYNIAVTYAGEVDPPCHEHAGYPYDFVFMQDDGSEINGHLDVIVEPLDDPDTPLCIAAFTRVDEAGAANETGIAGNWRAADGYWCSLMEEGLIFCFNDQDDLIADGTFALADDALAVTLNGADATARFDGETLLLTIGGVERAYNRA